MKSSVFLKAILFLFLMGTCLYGQYTTIEKPWEYNYWKENHPYIENIGGKWLWISVPMDSTLYEIRLENVSTLNVDSDAAGYIIEAKTAYSNADDESIKCFDAREYLKERQSSLAGSIGNWSCTLDMRVGSTEIPNDFLLCWANHIGEDTYWQEVYDHCGAYGVYWESTMTNSVVALETSMDRVYANYSSARDAYDEINQSGLCDSDYTGKGHSECLAVQTAVDVIEGNSTEGSYGIFNMVEADTENIKKEVYNPKPDMINYSGTMNLIWKDGGVLDMLGKLKAKAEKAQNDAQADYNATKLSADTGKTNVKTLRDRIDDEKLGLITTALTETGTVGTSSSGTIADRYDVILEKSEETEDNYNNALTSRTTTGAHGYLKDAIKYMRAADQGYGALESSIPILESNAKGVVSAEKTEAVDKIAEAKALVTTNATSSFVRGKVSSAEHYYSMGVNASEYGNQYRYFSLAAADAREAISKNSNQSFDEAIALAALKKQFQDLINKAKNDSLNTYSQEATLKSLEGEDYEWVDAALRAAEDELVAQETLQYGYLDDKRAELITKIKLVGGDDDDLLTDMANAERGIIGSDGKIDYRKGLGKLNALADTYEKIEGQLDNDVKKIVSHSLMAEAESYVDAVALDSPSNITIDVLVINTEKYNASDVELVFDVPLGIDLKYSDIKNGSDDVGSVLMEGTEAKIYLKSVEPYEKKRITFQTKETLAHTTSMKKNASGLGGGSASINEEINFRLDADVDSLTIPDGVENARIDGMLPGRQLTKGNHRITASYNLEDAYNESVSNVKSVPIGLNAQVDYVVVFDPKIDLDEVTFYVDPGAKISNLNVYAIAGGTLGKKTKISDDKYSYTMTGLEAGTQASAKVSYIIENSSGYITQELALLNGMNMSTDVKKLVSEAEAAFSSGNTSTALVRINEAKAEIEKEADTQAKDKRSVEKLLAEVKAELSDINTALADGKGLSSSFITKLSARADELSKRINESADESPADALRSLGEIDQKWLSKEITSFRKDGFTEYNDLKERFVKAGNLTTPSEFIAVESDLDDLEVSGRVGYAIDLIDDLDRAELLVSAQESANTAARSGMKNAFESLKQSVRDDMEKYNNESASAKGTEFSSLFTWTEKSVESKITDIEKSLNSSDPSLLTNKINDLNKTGGNIAGTLSLLKNQSENKLDLIRDLYNSSKDRLELADQETYAKRIESMRKLMESGQYVNSLRAGNKILEDLQTAKKSNDNSLLLIGVSALAVLGVAGAYFYKQRETKGPGEKKILKKLERAE